MPDKPSIGKVTYGLRQIGSTGLPVWSGRVYDEPLVELQGDRGRRIFREMSEQDPILGGTLFGIEMLASQVNWTITPTDSEDDEAKEIADFYDECLTDLNPSWGSTLSEIFSMLKYGWSWFEIVYKRREGLNFEDPRKSSRFDDGKIGWASFSIRSQDTLDTWEYENADGTGRLLGMNQWVPWAYNERRTTLIPRTKSLHFTTRANRENPEGVSLLRNAYSSWFKKKAIEAIEGIGIERDLAGLPVIWAPQSIFSEDATPEEKALFEELKKIATNIKRDEQEGLVMPMAYDDTDKANPLFKLELLSTGGERQFDTNGIINRYDSRMAMSMLADFMLLGHEAQGSFAIAKQKTNLFSVALSAFLDMIADEMNLSAFPTLALANGFPINKIPSLGHGKIESVDLAALGEYLKQLFAAGMQVFPNPELEEFVLGLAGLKVDPGAGMLPFPVDEQGNPLGPDGQPMVPGVPMPSLVPKEVADGAAAAQKPPESSPKQKNPGTARKGQTPVSSARPRAKIAAAEEPLKAHAAQRHHRHFTPLAQRVAKLHKTLSDQLEPSVYSAFLVAVAAAGSYSKLSREYQDLITQAERES